MNIFNEGLLSKMLNEYHLFTDAFQYKAVFFVFLLISAVVSYLLGSLNSAIIVSKLLYKQDVRDHGSGNAGLTNTIRVYGMKAGVLTLLGDMLKTALAIYFTAFLLGISYRSGISFNDGYCYMAGMFAVLGHIFPIYYGFKGGKGVLVTATMVLILAPIPFLILLCLFFIILLIGRMVSLGSVSVAILFPAVVRAYVRFVLGARSMPIAITVCTIILAVLVIWCHRSNLKRIINKTESKISLGGKKKKDE